jgi:hypothetical protein
MKRRGILLALGAGVLVGSASAGRDGAVDHDGGTGLLGGLKVGQPVTLKDLGVAYEVGVMGDRFPTGQEVAEVGADYLVVRDVTEAVETRIPVTSIKAVVRVATEP